MIKNINIKKKVYALVLSSSISILGLSGCSFRENYFNKIISNSEEYNNLLDEDMKLRRLKVNEIILDLNDNKKNVITTYKLDDSISPDLLLEHLSNNTIDELNFEILSTSQGEVDALDKIGYKDYLISFISVKYDGNYKFFEDIIEVDMDGNYKEINNTYYTSDFLDYAKSTGEVLLDNVDNFDSPYTNIDFNQFRYADKMEDLSVITNTEVEVYGTGYVEGHIKSFSKK